MGLMNQNPAAPQPKTEYFTETGEFVGNFLSHTSEMLHDQFAALCNAMRNTDAIYCPFSLRTGEPYLYMDVLRDAEGYGFSRARIQVWTEQENARLAPEFTRPDVEIVRIPAGENGSGIPGFLGMAFYENGAEYAVINGVDCPIPADAILPPPDLSRMPEHQRPLLNPRVLRWQCHLAQLIGQENPLVRDLQELFMTQLGNALLSAKVLLPLLVEDSGKSFSVPAWSSRDGREYVKVFTDWRRLHKGMDETKNWSAKTETVASLIRQYDLALNSNSFRSFGIYIDQHLFDLLSGK